MVIVKTMCKVEPDHNICCSCIDNQVDYHRYEDCSKCRFKSEEYELIEIVPGLFGKDYAYVLKDGKIRRVNLDRIFGVKICLEGESSVYD